MSTSSLSQQFLGQPPRAASLLEGVEQRRLALSSRDRIHRANLGQFFTPVAVARFMASMSVLHRPHVRLLDAGAGVGSLTAAWVAALCARTVTPDRVTLTCYELDTDLLPSLRDTLKDCEALCEAAGVGCTVDLRNADFLEAAAENLGRGLFGSSPPVFDAAILNPPYRKFRADSRPRLLLRRLGLETSNLYTAFLALAVELLESGGELIAITPRSFCNGPYFRPFRDHILHRVSIAQLHTFELRDHAFRDDAVLQENIILRAVKDVPQQPTVRLSDSRAPDEPERRSADVAFQRVVWPNDPQLFIHVSLDESDQALADAMHRLPCTIDDLGLAVSTGPVVDFRSRVWLRSKPEAGTAPLIYPTHLEAGRVRWPRTPSKKPNAIVVNDRTSELVVAAGVYVLVKRFSSKEERRRVVAAVFDPSDVPCHVVGFENHLNYYHAKGAPVEHALAWGLVAFLNSSPLDAFFRQFSGHTQVNAADLRTVRYPSAAALRRIGDRLGGVLPAQDDMDRLLLDLLASV